jgi:broad specificity phosphatase PhoE
MLKFYIIRHGNKENIPFNPPLTVVGEKQAQLTASFLKDIKFKTLLASPKLRTTQTAGEISKKLGIPIDFDERLIERMEWEYDKTFEEFIKEWENTDRDRSFVPSKGESSNNKGILMRQVFDELSQKYKEGNIVIVTHGGAIGDLLRNISSKIKLPNRKEPLTGFRYSAILECSITILQKNKNGFEIIQVGNIDHLLSFKTNNL